MGKYMFLLLASLILISCGDGSFDHKEKKIKEDLINRINDYYSSWKRLDLAKMWEFLPPDEAGDKQEFLERWGKVDLKVKDYHILDIQISNGNARVKIEATFTEHGEEFTDTSFDYWKIEKGKWVLVDSGRKK